MLNFSRHAMDRMAEREITEDEVNAALRHTSGPPQPGDNGNLVVRGYAGGRILKVVLTSDQQVVVSVMELDS